MKIRNILATTILISSFITGCQNEDIITPGPYSVNPSYHNADYAVQWLDLLYKIIAQEGRFNPPQGSRVYAYSCITVYESVWYGIPFHRSLSGQLNGMPVMPRPDIAGKVYDWPSVLTGSMSVVIRGILESPYNTTAQRITNLYNSQAEDRRKVVPDDVVTRSIEYGEALGSAILNWASQDRYHSTRGLGYTPPPRSINPANWEPINPGDTAVEPYWGTLRTYVLPSAHFCRIPPDLPFDTAVGSPFYNDENEVRIIRNNITQEQRDIAIFWRDKQLTGTPAGHWVSIMNQMVSHLSLNLERAAKMYALGGITIGDAFISAWEAKYKYNLLRPQSYIRDYIQTGWQPFLPTPPFPDYPSGHSTGSGAIAEVLTSLFGIVAFTDRTHESIGMAPRSFNSFEHAAIECSDSRIYGGIHYRDACENGIAQGKRVGRTVIGRINFRIY